VAAVHAFPSTKVVKDVELWQTELAEAQAAYHDHSVRVVLVLLFHILFWTALFINARDAE
jgi:hypothetical protein